MIWYEDNSMVIEHTVDQAATGATVVATILSMADEPIGDPITLSPSGTDYLYRATVHPTGDYDLPRTRHRLRVVATYGGATMETEEVFTPRVRRGSA